ncbi:hypothetical protein C8R45DRAFT_1106766 [Mycena sanguinolenta]|nr:hypothetical protein C8R45DRAFT_1106766 [Mycena sanguinolenta]
MLGAFESSQHISEKPRSSPHHEGGTKGRWPEALGSFVWWRAWAIKYGTHTEIQNLASAGRNYACASSDGVWAETIIQEAMYHLTSCARMQLLLSFSSTFSWVFEPTFHTRIEFTSHHILRSEFKPSPDSSRRATFTFSTFIFDPHSRTQRSCISKAAVLQISLRAARMSVVQPSAHSSKTHSLTAILTHFERMHATTRARSMGGPREPPRTRLRRARCAPHTAQPAVLGAVRVRCDGIRTPNSRSSEDTALSRRAGTSQGRRRRTVDAARQHTLALNSVQSLSRRTLRASAVETNGAPAKAASATHRSHGA